MPKDRKTCLHELSDDQAAALGRVLPRLARAVMKATGASAYNVLQNNGAVAHQAMFRVHFHIIRRRTRAGSASASGWGSSRMARRPRRTSATPWGRARRPLRLWAQRVAERTLRNSPSPKCDPNPKARGPRTGASNSIRNP
ncbi:MAG: HIT domain-containing protein [Sandaracinaceae bacterium]